MYFLLIKSESIVLKFFKFLELSSRWLAFRVFNWKFPKNFDNYTCNFMSFLGNGGCCMEPCRNWPAILRLPEVKLCQWLFIHHVVWRTKSDLRRVRCWRQLRILQNGIRYYVIEMAKNHHVVNKINEERHRKFVLMIFFCPLRFLQILRNGSRFE